MSLYQIKSVVPDPTSLTQPPAQKVTIIDRDNPLFQAVVVVPGADFLSSITNALEAAFCGTTNYEPNDAAVVCE